MKKHSYKIVLEFSSDKPLKKTNKNLIQFENLLPYLYDDKVNSTFIEGTAKLSREKITAVEEQQNDNGQAERLIEAARLILVGLNKKNHSKHNNNAIAHLFSAIASLGKERKNE